MKKILIIILIAVVAMSSIGGVYIATHLSHNAPIQDSLPEKALFSAKDLFPFQEEIFETGMNIEDDSLCCNGYKENQFYEIVDFKAPDKKTYTMNDVYDMPLIGEDGTLSSFCQQIDFDGTGTSMTLRNKQTGEITKYEYNCTYVKTGDVDLKFEDSIYFDFPTEMDEVLTEGIYTAMAIVMTPDNECIRHDFTFTLTDR